MTPVSPVIPGIDPSEERTFGGPACGQPEYIPVPALVNSARPTYITSRYRLTAEEREWVAKGADLFLTFLGGMPPHIVEIINVNTESPYYSAEAVAKSLRMEEFIREPSVPVEVKR